MPRAPLATALKSRDGAVAKDGKVVNAILEREGEEGWKARKRPGMSDQGIIRAGVAQFLGYWNDMFVTVQDDYINLAGGYTFATWNPADLLDIVLSGGNLTATSTTNWRGVRSTIGVSSGKHYWEITAPGTNPQYFLGVGKATATLSNFIGFDANGWGYRAIDFASGGGKHNNNVRAAYVPCSDTTFSVGEVIGVALDMDLGTITLYRGGVSQGVMYTGITGPVFAMCNPVVGGGDAVTANFGATPFVYDIPAGHRRGLYTTGGASASSTYLNPTTADLPFSGQDNGANAPTSLLMVKNAQQAWTVDRAGNIDQIVDVDYPGTYRVTLTSLTRVGTVATATTPTDTNFQVGSTVVIAGATPSDYNGAKVITGINPSTAVTTDPVDITITRSGTTATAAAAEPHEFTNGQVVTIEGSDQTEYNGAKTITWLSATTFSFTVTVSNTVTSPATGSPVAAISMRAHAAWIYNVSGGVATVAWQATPHGLETGAFVAVSGSGGVGPIIATGPITVTTPYLFTFPTSHADFSTSVAGTATQTLGTLTVSSITASGGVATVTMSGSHHITANNNIVVTGAAQSYYNVTPTPVTVTGATTFTYPLGAVAESPTTPGTGDITVRATTVTGASFTFSQGGSPTTPATGTITAAGGRNTVPGIAYMDGYFHVMDVNGVISSSDEDEPRSWNALNYRTALAETGAGKHIARSLNYVVAIKEYSTEFFFTDPQNEVGSPLSPVPNLFTLVGCVNGFSVAEVAGRLLWVAQEKKHKGRTVYMMAGTEQAKVSTEDVERILNADALVNVDAFGVKLDGHPCYVLTLTASNITLVYDLVSQVWTQWSSLTIGANKSITSITRSGTTATATFALAHSLADGDPLKVSGANQSEYNGIFQVSYVSATVVTYEVTGTPATPATGTLIGNTYTESCFKFPKYASGGGNDALLHETDGHIYYIDSTLKQDAGVPINLFARSDRFDGDTMARKKNPRISVVNTPVADTAMIRWSDDDCVTFVPYRRATLSDQEPMLRQCGAFKRRTFEYRHVGNTAPVVDALELEITR